MPPRPQRRWPWLLALLSTSAAAQISVSTTTLTMPDCPASNPVFIDVYRPTGAGPFPTVALGHGFVMGKGTMEGLGRALAEAGLLTVAPEFPALGNCGDSDHARNGRILLAAIDQQVALGLVDGTRVGVGGHSAGGLSALLAAGQRAMQVVVLLDPVDANGEGLAQAATVLAPTFFINAEPTVCSAQNNSAPWYAPKPAPKARLRVVGSNHCEPEEPLNPLCTLTCGATWTSERAAKFKTSASAFFRRYLLGQRSPCLEATAGADVGVADVDFRLETCVSVDAGVGPAITSSGCTCAAAPAGAAWALLAGLLWRRKRRASSSCSR
jgi:acetyl esterase/lipase